MGNTSVDVAMSSSVTKTGFARQRSRPDLTDAAEFKARFGFEPIADRQLQAALDVLKGVRLLGDRTASRGSQ